MLYFFCGWMDVLSCSVRGLGKSTLSMINSLLGSCAFRLLWFSIVFPLWHPANGVSIQLVYPISWALTALIQLIVYRRLVRKLEIRFDAGSGAESGAARDESPART